MPVTEYADLTVSSEREGEFLAAILRAVPIFRAAKGCRGMRLDRHLDRSLSYRLTVVWDTLADHTEVFRASTGFQEWRAIAGPFFTSAPVVEHVETIVKGF